MPDVLGEGLETRARRPRLRGRRQRRRRSSGRAPALRARHPAARLGERVADRDARRSGRHRPLVGRALVVVRVDVGLAVDRVGLRHGRARRSRASSSTAGSRRPSSGDRSATPRSSVSAARSARSAAGSSASRSRRSTGHVSVRHAHGERHRRVRRGRADRAGGRARPRDARAARARDRLPRRLHDVLGLRRSRRCGSPSSRAPSAAALNVAAKPR